MNVTNKKQMYRMLTAGEFGNTIEQFFSVEEWLAAGAFRQSDWWGVRTLTPGGPCKLNCRVDDVVCTAIDYTYAGHAVNISLMIDRAYDVTAWLEVWDSPTGLVVEGIEYPPKGSSWRELMPTKRRSWSGVQARMILARHLNPNSLEDVNILIDRYKNHVLELSACSRCLGTLPHRNAVMWEVRQY